MHDVVLRSIVADELLLLVLLLVDGLLGVGLLVLLFLGDFVGLLLLRLLVDNSQTSLQALQLSLNRLELS